MIGAVIPRDSEVANLCQINIAQATLEDCPGSRRVPFCLIKMESRDVIFAREDMRRCRVSESRGVELDRAYVSSSASILSCSASGKGS